MSRSVAELTAQINRLACLRAGTNRKYCHYPMLRRRRPPALQGSACDASRYSPLETAEDRCLSVLVPPIARPTLVASRVSARGALGERRDEGELVPRLRPDGSLVPRNGFVGDPVHRVDMRFQQRISIGARRSIDGILELFNVLNRANYGSYVTDEASRQFGQPEYNSNLAYAPRTLQLGFRLTF